jgi:predicted nucleotidyltransferase
VALVAACPEVRRVLLFGSLARDDYGPRSDLDVLVVTHDENPRPQRERGERYRWFLPVWPAEVFVYTETELEERLAAGDPFLARAVAEGLVLASASG